MGFDGKEYPLEEEMNFFLSVPLSVSQGKIKRKQMEEKKKEIKMPFLFSFLSKERRGNGGNKRK